MFAELFPQPYTSCPGNNFFTYASALPAALSVHAHAH
jgi:hypothetical protein